MNEGTPDFGRIFRESYVLNGKTGKRFGDKSFFRRFLPPVFLLIVVPLCSKLFAHNVIARAEESRLMPK